MKIVHMFCLMLVLTIPFPAAALAVTIDSQELTAADFLRASQENNNLVSHKSTGTLSNQQTIFLADDMSVQFIGLSVVNTGFKSPNEYHQVINTSYISPSDLATYTSNEKYVHNEEIYVKSPVTGIWEKSLENSDIISPLLSILGLSSQADANMIMYKDLQYLDSMFSYGEDTEKDGMLYHTVKLYMDRTRYLTLIGDIVGNTQNYISSNTSIDTTTENMTQFLADLSNTMRQVEIEFSAIYYINSHTLTLDRFETLTKIKTPVISGKWEFDSESVIQGNYAYSDFGVEIEVPFFER